MSTRNRPETISFHHLQSLKPFEPSRASEVLQLRFSVQRTTENALEFAFTMTADQPKDIAAVVLPVPKSEAERERKDELWKHTCLEIFVGPEAGSTYLEMNLSPAGDWNVYAFDSYRNGMRAVGTAFDGRGGPLVSFERSFEGGALTWKGHLVPTGRADSELDRVLSAPSLVMGATAVLEYQNGEREYWALEHSGPKPDFHLRKSFRLKL